MLATCLLECQINLSILAYMIYVGRYPVSAMQWLEDLIIVDLSLELVVDDDLEAQVCLLPYEHIYSCAMGE